MALVVYKSEILTPAGTLRVAVTDRGACALILPGVAEPKVRVAKLMAAARPGPMEHPILQPLLAACSRYFTGNPDALEGQSVDWTLLSDFQRKVYQLARTIPPGKVRSYGWIAEKLGKPRAARAVGQALASNPVPLVVPCHRIIAADGSLGGFTGGLPWKNKLLEIERRI